MGLGLTVESSEGDFSMRKGILEAFVTAEMCSEHFVDYVTLRSLGTILAQDH